MDFVAGIRHNQRVYVGYSFDVDSEDFLVTVELKDSDGNLVVATGQVVWDEGE